MRYVHTRLAAVLLIAGALLAGAGRTVAADTGSHYVLDPAKSTLEFAFTQAGANCDRVIRRGIFEGIIDQVRQYDLDQF